jgi:hypothetical protein
MRTSPTRPGSPTDVDPDSAPGLDTPPSMGAGTEARRLAAAILEVLAGLQTPSEAAGALGISLPRYYQIEVRALDGLVAACESRRRGRQPGSELVQLRHECERLKRECARQQALVRVTRRTVGLAEGPPPPPPKSEGRRRRRRPTVRALKVVAKLRTPAREEVSADPVATGSGDVGGTQETP